MPRPSGRRDPYASIFQEPGRIGRFKLELRLAAGGMDVPSQTTGDRENNKYSPRKTMVYGNSIEICFCKEQSDRRCPRIRKRKWNLLPRAEISPGGDAEASLSPQALAIGVILGVYALVLTLLHQNALRDTQADLHRQSLALSELAERTLQSVDLVLQSVVERIQPEASGGDLSELSNPRTLCLP